MFPYSYASHWPNSLIWSSKHVKRLIIWNIFINFASKYIKIKQYVATNQDKMQFSRRMAASCWQTWNSLIRCTFVNGGNYATMSCENTKLLVAKLPPFTKVPSPLLRLCYWPNMCLLRNYARRYIRHRDLMHFICVCGYICVISDCALHPRHRSALRAFTFYGNLFCDCTGRVICSATIPAV